MTIEERILTTLAGQGSHERRPASLLRLEAFYTRMKEKGLIRRSEYSIPPLDTVGREAYAETQSRAVEQVRSRG